MAELNETDARLLRCAFELARRARERGDEPFGAVIASRDGQILIQAVNTIHTSNDPTAHAEINALRRAGGLAELSRSTLYASTEPCPMCATGQVWAGVGRLVFGLSSARLGELVRDAGHGGPSIPWSCYEVLAHAQPAVEIVGPVLEREAEEVHAGYWGVDSTAAQPATNIGPTSRDRNGNG